MGPLCTYISIVCIEKEMSLFVDFTFFFFQKEDRSVVMSRYYFILKP